MRLTQLLEVFFVWFFGLFDKGIKVWYKDKKTEDLIKERKKKDYDGNEN